MLHNYKIKEIFVIIYSCCLMLKIFSILKYLKTKTHNDVYIPTINKLKKIFLII